MNIKRTNIASINFICILMVSIALSLARSPQFGKITCHDVCSFLRKWRTLPFTCDKKTLRTNVATKNCRAKMVGDKLLIKANKIDYRKFGKKLSSKCFKKCSKLSAYLKKFI